MRVGHSRLQTVIKVKQFQVTKAQRELAAVAHSRENEQHRLEHLEERHSNAMDDAARTTRARASDLQTNQAYIQTISHQIEKQGEKIDALKGEEEGKRVELVEKSQSKQMLEKLDLRRKAEADKEEERKSQRVLDVLAQRARSGM
jgi:flagellar export protein FliJ